MLLFLVIAVLLLSRRRWYGYCYHPYGGYPQYRDYPAYPPNEYGYVWNGYTWQARYPGAPYPAGYAYPYGYRHRPYR